MRDIARFGGSCHGVAIVSESATPGGLGEVRQCVVVDLCLSHADRRGVRSVPQVALNAADAPFVAGWVGYRYPGEIGKAAVELYPVTGKKSLAAARTAGLEASSIPTLLVEGDNKPGLGAGIARAMADAGVNLAFLVAQVMGRKYSAIMGFETEEEARKAAALIKRISAAKKK
jgi:predicted amino acid-binding ACT domain protein